jgi:hypothetical protein
LTRAVGTLSALRDAQVYAQHHGGSLRQNRLPRVPLLTGPLAWPDWKRYPSVSISLPLFRLHLALSLSDALAKTTPFLWASGRNFGAGTGCVWC